jgi:glycosyltransferase involved in cell wall biosynthesis
MHILIIPSWYKSNTEPVLGTFFEEQARALMQAGHQVGIIYPQFAPVSAFFQKKDDIIDFIDDNGLPTYSIIYQALIPKLRKLIYKKFSIAIQKTYFDYVLKFGKPDVIHAHSVFHGGMCAFFIAHNNKIPFVITEHLTSFMTGGITHDDDLQVARDIFNNADAAIIVSNNFKHDIEKALQLPANTFQVIHNLVADLFFENVIEKKYDAATENFEFFTNSFLLPRKNHKLIFDAVRILLNKGVHNFRLHVGGDGPLRNELENYVTMLELNEYVIFKGSLSRKEVKAAVDASHAFVLASTYETFGVVLIESLACGRPVVTTDSGGPKDFINATNGIFASEYNAHALAEAMLDMMLNYHRFDQLTISKTCRANFAESKIEKEIENLYGRVLEYRPLKNSTEAV